MLQNLKVGTKLFVILLAPMIVVVALVAAGVRDRRASATDASRVEELSSFALVGSDLEAQLEAEQLYSATFVASDAATGRSDLDAQRGRTDVALERYENAIAELDAGDEDGALALSIGLVGTRLVNLDNIRRTVDNSPSEPYSIGEIYGDVVSTVVGVNATLSGYADDRDLLQGLDAMSRVEQVRTAMADQATLLVGAADRGAFTDRAGIPCPRVTADCESYARATEAGQAFSRARDSLSLSGATPEQKRAVVNAEGLSTYEGVAGDVLGDAVDGNTITTPGSEMLAASIGGLDGLSAVGTDLTKQVVDEARAQEDAASRSVVLYLLVGAAALAIAFAIAVIVARSITGPLSRLTKAAARLSDEQLPSLVQQLRNPEDEEAEAVAETLTPIEVDSQDELGELAAAFNSIQAVTVDVAEEQGRLLRKGIGDIFVNLARRNQSLLDRQIEFIDHLESNERDPDQLENLFRLDHLATRMRRNAESLLVMAGADPPRRRGAPVPVSDVVRVAIGEVEDFQRVHLLALDEATVAANVAADLAHLLSELMENATNASPPHTSVEVLGGYDARNGYVLTVADRGIGMSEAQLDDANHHLAHPPMVGLVISRSLGLTVVGRLAARYGLSVRLEAREGGGVVATVELPYGLVEYPGEDVEPAPSALDVMAAVDGRPSRARRGNRPASPAPVPVGMGVTIAGAREVDEPTPMTPAPVAPTPAGLPRRRQAAPAPEPTLAPEPSPAPGVVTGAPPAHEVAPPTLPERAAPPASDPPAMTAAGLVKRTPKTGPSAAPVDGANGRAVTRTSRSPEEVRRMLSRYRSGLDRGRTDSPTDGGTDTTGTAVPPTQGVEE